MKHWRRILRHLWYDGRTLRRVLPRAAMQRITVLIGAQEQRHCGELRFAVEAALPLQQLWRGQQARERALEVFGLLRIWDTEHNNGVLIYVLLADKRVEIVADRGIHRKVGDAAWEVICGEMQREFASGRFERGVELGIAAVSDLLAAHFPPGTGRANELPDEPAII